jgi:hypothetical protein
MNHTPGPWRWFNYPDGRKLLTGRDCAVIHCADAPMTCDPPDASLIAAAPDLLDALKDCVAAFGGRSANPDAIPASALAAIAKAEGRG